MSEFQAKPNGDGLYTYRPFSLFEDVELIVTGEKAVNPLNNKSAEVSRLRGSWRKEAAK